MKKRYLFPVVCVSVCLLACFMLITILNINLEPIFSHLVDGGEDEASVIRELDRVGFRMRIQVVMPVLAVLCLLVMMIYLYVETERVRRNVERQTLSKYVAMDVLKKSVGKEKDEN
ncbi:hypothetical protein O9G_000699 [Rozella allomycis CSF55]|uniref:Uncharacterized protein n=1 Tax=Rozella allomycis (strain CSF55) TaxID=988480 RepID=A0A075B3B5_ROZAC|nr:hypothetical protein O9G_000699 [Rozella allomycis CSF55]|eukprot:EPZ35303.1 hypothetical protein O9G_000699 [Rozella allomycis CSF55]